MPAFLITLFGWLAQTKLGQLFVTYIGNKVVGWVKAEIERRKKKEQIKQEIKKAIDPLKTAKNGDELDDAIDKALDDI